MLRQSGSGLSISHGRRFQDTAAGWLGSRRKNYKGCKVSILKTPCS